MAVDEHYYEVATPGSLTERLMIHARGRIYADFLAACLPQPSDTILDVGVSDVLHDGANMLERLYPHPNQITACGISEAREFQSAFPAIRYRQIDAGAPLPFAEKSFDVAISNAVLEHVGGTGNQRRLVAEMARVALRVFISVPHRFFPIEHHTAIPFAHWTDTTFRLACALTRRSTWAREEQLRLMSWWRLASVVPESVPYRIGYTGLWLGPLSSNLYLVIK